MSIHQSLKLKNTLARKRSVLTRWERILKLQEEERWEEGDSVMGLPKVRTVFKVRSRKAAEDKEDEAANGDEAATTEES